MHRDEQGVFQNVGSWKFCRILRNLCSATHCRGAFCDQVLKSVIHLPCIPFPYFWGSVTVIRLGSSCRSYVSRISESLVKSWSPTINVSLLPTITLAMGYQGYREVWFTYRRFTFDISTEKCYIVSIFNSWHFHKFA